MSAQPKSQPQAACQACDAMWREYAHALAEHLKLQLGVYMAAADGNGYKESVLDEQLVTAEARRNAARDVIRLHEGKAHQNNS